MARGRGSAPGVGRLWPSPGRRVKPAARCPGSMLRRVLGTARPEHSPRSAAPRTPPRAADAPASGRPQSSRRSWLWIAVKQTTAHSAARAVPVKQMSERPLMKAVMASSTREEGNICPSSSKRPEAMASRPGAHGRASTRVERRGAEHGDSGGGTQGERGVRRARSGPRAGGGNHGEGEVHHVGHRRARADADDEQGAEGAGPGGIRPQGQTQPQQPDCRHRHGSAGDVVAVAEGGGRGGDDDHRQGERQEDEPHLYRREVLPPGEPEDEVRQQAEGHQAAREGKEHRSGEGRDPEQVEVQ